MQRHHSERSTTSSPVLRRGTIYRAPTGGPSASSPVPLPRPPARRVTRRPAPRSAPRPARRRPGSTRSSRPGGARRGCCPEFRDTIHNYLRPAFFGPGFWRLRTRPNFFSKRFWKSSSPKARPVLSCSPQRLDLFFGCRAGQESSPVLRQRQQRRNLHKAIILPLDVRASAAPAILARRRCQPRADRLEFDVACGRRADRARRAPAKQNALAKDAPAIAGEN